MSESEKDKIAGQGEGESRTGQFSIQKIYVKDVSFETPNSPQVFQKQWQPSVNMDLTSSARTLDKSYYEVVLSVTVTVTHEEETIYLAEVQQAGIFQLSDIPEELVKQMLATACPNILFPFARETVADLVSRGGFPQLLLAPVNFEALYLQRQQKEQTLQ